MVLSNSPITIGALTLNAVDGNGTKWIVQKFDGWGTSTPTLLPVQKPRQSGASVGDSFSTGRTLTLSGMIVSTSPAQHSLDTDTLIDNVNRSATLLSVSESGRVRSVNVYRSADVILSRLNHMMSTFTVQVFAKDWRKFGTPLTGSTMLPASSGGLTFPATWPATFSAVQVSGQLSLTNPGNETGPVSLRIDGPCTGPIITHVGSAQSLVFSSSLVLNTGEFLLVDMEKRTVLANGQSSRNGYITSRGWSGFDPGNNTWSFAAATYNAASQLTVTATPSWE
jgi:hypothetical protein